MALILAIEPDREQAALLTSLIRTRLLSAELVLTDTTAQALVAIGDRVPALVLIPALLSPQEDATLAGALRMIAAAAQVQMLTIPLLAAAAAAPEPRGVLAKWRRGRSAAARPAGCDPAVFADQIAAYLAEAAEKPAADAALVAVVEIPPVVAAIAPTPTSVETVAEPQQVFAVVADALPAFVAETPAFAPVAEPPPAFEQAAYTPTIFEPAYAPTVVEPLVETPTVFAAVVETPIVLAAVAEAPQAFEAAYIPIVVEAVVETPTVVAVVETPIVVAPVAEIPFVVAPVAEVPVVVAPVAQAPVAFEVAYTPPVSEAVAETPMVVAPVAEIAVETIEVVRVKTPARRFALIDWQHADVEAPALSTRVSNAPHVEGPVVSDAPPIHVEGPAPVVRVEAPALSDGPIVRVEGTGEAEEAFAAEWGDDPMVRAIKQFVPAPIAADRVRVAEPVAQPVQEMAATPALSDARVVGVEEPLLAIASVEAAPVAESLVSEPIVHQAHTPIVATVQDVVAAVPPLDALRIRELASAPLSTEAVANTPRVDETSRAIHNTVDTTDVDADVVIDFDETPVYELSLDELASDAALMASIDAMMAPRLKDQAKQARPQAARLAPPAREESVERQTSPIAPSTSGANPARREEAIIERTAVVAAKTVLVSQRAVEMPAAESGPIERIPQLQTEPDPLFFCDAKPAALASNARVPRAPVAPVAVAAPVAPVAPVAVATAAAPAAAKPEWVELIESLRKDIERLKAERTVPAAAAAHTEAGATASAAVAAPDATAPSPVAIASAAPKAKRAKPVAKKTPRPAQDEWGLFDPEQCGFASLLAKLSEITEGNDNAPSSRELNH